MENSSTSTSRGAWLKRAAGLIVLLAIMDGLLFGAAGRLDWWGAWLWSGLYFLFLLVVVIWTSLKAPGLMEERSHKAKNVKRWDTVITSIYTVLLIGLLVTAGLDAGRFRWTAMPWFMQALGVGILVFSGVVIWRVITVNYYLSRYARIQDDRDQKVVSDGPYRHVRHPMYAVLIIFMLGIALVLGSGWALVPASFIGVLIVVRTALEDKMLQNELPGYREYAQKVRYRLLPGIW